MAGALLSPAALPLSFDPPQEVARAIGAAAAERPLALFLDFDGTLAQLVPRPEDAALPAGVGDLLVALARRHLVAIVSGRSLEFLRERCDLAGIVLAGSHGYEIAAPNVPPAPVATQEAQALVAAAAAALGPRLAGIAGVQLEPKRFAVAVHWRHVAPAGLPAVEAAVASVAALLPGLIRTGGHFVHELRPALPWHKGAAVEWLLQHAESLPGRPPCPVVVGDDLTDLDMLAVGRRLGVAVAVGPTLPAAAAPFRLEGPPEVAAVLASLAA